MFDNPWIMPAAFCLAAYVIGSTPFGVIIARAQNVDLRKCGSGNVGATNVWRVLGRRWGLLCFVLDVAKGLAPVLCVGLVAAGGEMTMLHQATLLAAALGAVCGHVFSFYLRFRGGKGVATSLGVVLAIYPYFTFPALVAFAAWGLTLRLSRYVSLASITATIIFMGAFTAFNWGILKNLVPLGVFATLMSLLIIVRHRTNIARIIAGTENKIGA